MRRIFVVGCPRSGTTLVQQLLGARHDTYTCTETHYFQRIRRVGKLKLLDYVFLSRDRVSSALDFIRAHNALLGQYDPTQARTIRSAVLFLDQVMTTEALARDKLAWVEKTPAHVFYIGWIRRHLPSAQIVHVLRDGRDTVASMVDAAQRFPQARAWKGYADVDTALGVYTRCVKESLKYRGRQGHHFIHYEQILDGAEAASLKLYAALGLATETPLLDRAAIHGQIVRSDEEWKDSFGGTIQDTRLVKFQRVFDAQQQERVCRRLASLATHSTLPIPAGDRPEHRAP